MKRDFPIHLDLQGVMDEQCFGELEEYCESKPGYPSRVYYICAGCGQKIDGSIVLNHDRDTADWEFDMRYQGSY